ncbi:unnamed protein product [Urochloa humidicola]
MASSSKRKEEEVVDDDGDGTAAASRGRDGLLFTLVQRLQVCRPALVLRKPLVRSYLSRRQNYLGITRAEYARGFAPLLTDEERSRVRSGGVGSGGGGGLPVRALDRRGVEYRMVLAHLEKTYRLRAGWGRFLRNAGVRQDDGADSHVGDVVEVWAFRSPAWETKLGLVLLHYTKEEDAQMTAVVDDDEEAVAVSAAITLVSMKRD